MANSRNSIWLNRPKKMKLGDYVRQIKRITFMVEILEAL